MMEAILGNNIVIWVPFIISFGASLVLVPLVRWVARKAGKVVQPRSDRWHNRPTPYMGGIGIFLSFLVAAYLIEIKSQLPMTILLGAALAFLLGVIDDLYSISPQFKLIGLFVAASPVVFSKYITAFFPWTVANVAISFIWIVGIANAFNLLDNMDGLAGGTALLVAGFFAIFFWRYDDIGLVQLALAIAGATLGFWIFNFPPASIFMGDSGSLFLGFILAALAIVRKEASNVFAVVGVPTLIFLLPILDTAMVSVTRLLRGQSPAMGGRDHTSHRLVALGLSERQTLFFLMGASFISGVAAILLEELSYHLSLILIPLVVLIFTLVSAYLGQIKVVEPDPSDQKGKNTLTNWVVELTYRRRILEILLDFFLIAFAYYLAYVIRLGLPLSDAQMASYLKTLPIMISVTFIAFFIFGVYQGVWRYVSIEDVFRYVKGAILGTSIAAGAVWLFRLIEVYSIEVFVLYGMLLLLITLASRFSFRLLDRAVSSGKDHLEIPILIYGAGDAGELALRECQQNTGLGYKPVGFIDDDPLKEGRIIHGLRVLGSIDDLESLIESQKVGGVIIASSAIEKSEAGKVAIAVCDRSGIWIQRLRLEFEYLA